MYKGISLKSYLERYEMSKCQKVLFVFEHTEVIGQFLSETSVSSQIKLHARNTILSAGVGKLLRLYDLGRKKLLRKCENKHIPHLVVDIKTVGERIICSDVQVIRTKR